MVKFPLVVVGMMAALGSYSAMAVDIQVVEQSDSDRHDSDRGDDHSRSIAWTELKNRCISNGSEKAALNIKLQCTELRDEWVADAPGEIPLGAKRRVVSAVFADSFHVGAEARDYALVQKGGSCLRFKKVQKSLTVERALSCAEITAAKTVVTPQDLCLTALDSAKTSNPKLVAVRDLGKVIDTCRNRDDKDRDRDGDWN